MAKENATTSEQTLQQQVEQLRSEISNIGSTLSEIGADKLNKAKNRARTMYANAKEAGGDTLADAKDKVSDMQEQVCHYVREKPVTSLAIAAGIGFIAAMLIRR